MAHSSTKHNKIQRRKNFWGYLFIAPNFIGFVVFMLLPILMSLYYSFTDYDVITEANFVGFENYIKLFQHALVLRADGPGGRDLSFAAGGAV